MANIGELFKFLGANETFIDLCQESDKTNQQIIEIVFQNEDLISSVRSIVQDDNIIKSKMDILIGQKRKGQNKKPKQEQIVKDEPIEKHKPEEEKTIKFKCEPIDPSKVTYLDNFAYIEPVDHRIRLVTHDYEMYY